ncbi:MAG TPA: exosortase system-associated protein, TIGR04073 family [Candidatus Sulfopaludibacter sp.]|nr:exosortase system-associated protein, TIGR04073 family [Candidatus Sulfopaludibacter sp.]
MRNALTFLSVVAVAALFTSGCAGPEQKLGRGMSNVAEAARGGEWRRSVEQTAVFDSPEAGYTVGFVRGFDRSVARTGVGLYEVITFPFPPYHPIFTKYLAPEPVYPDNYTPGLWSDSMFDTDTYVGMSGGDVAPFVPGSRFKVFDNN